MEKIDIAKEKLYFKKLINVLTTQLGVQKNIRVEGRHSDAFVFVTQGSCRYTFPEDGYTVTVQKGDLLYLAHHAKYTMHILTDRYSSIYCDFEFDAPIPGKSQVYPLKNPAVAENLFQRLYHSFPDTSAAAFARCMSILYDIHALVLASEKGTYIGTGAKDKLLRAKQLIDQRYTDCDLSISDVAAYAQMSEEYLRKLFRAQLGIAPSKYIASLRLERAKELMKYPFLTLEECALQSGFSSLQYFCHVFKAATGTTPAKYRKNESKNSASSLRGA